MIQIRRSEDRGHVSEDWLDTYHTFSFSDYYDPKFMGFRDLRVINEDRVAAGEGFPTHPHDNMEIVTYIIEGALEHKDSMGTGSVIRPGDIQRMSAGTGVTHSEFNHSKDKACHLLQIWILPERKGLKPEYEQKFCDSKLKQNKLKLVVSRDGMDESVKVHQDIRIFSSLLDSGKETVYEVPQGRYAWLQLISGALEINGNKISAGDGVAVSPDAARAETLKIRASQAAEFLLFDLN
jgi:quercetin 2,3-dioxygenase